MRDIIAIVVIVLISIATMFGTSALHAYASPLTKQQEPGCVQFAKAGMWDVFHCVDPNGNEFEANSAGMMIAIGN